MLVDVHAHITHKDVNPETVIDQAKKNNVKRIVTNGLTPRDNKDVLHLSKKYKEIQPAIGIYPRNRENQKEFFKQLHNEQYKAIGEVGLDYTKEDSETERREQKVLFEKIVGEARNLRKPLIIHSRGAEKDVLTILSEKHAYNPILHCFTGNKNQWRKAQSKGYYLSIPTNITRSEHFQHIVKDTPLHQLLTESDTPYLSPDKSYPNTPANVKRTVEIIAELKGLTYEDTAYNIFMNYQRLFSS